MSRAVSSTLALLLLLATALPVAGKEPAAGEPDGASDPQPPVSSSAGEVIPGEVLVKWRDTARGLDVAASRGLAVVAELGAAGKGLPASLVSTEGRPVDEVIAELKADPSVEAVEPNYTVQLADEGTLAAVPVNDPNTGNQYSLDRMRVRDAWALATGASNVIAVLDTGVQFDHPDLAGRLLAGRDFVNGDNDASDDNGHGTWVSGIIAANANDGYGMAGISWSDRILPVKIMSREGTGSTANLLAAITWSADQGADVINMSVGGFPYSQLMQDAVNYAFSKGAVLVGAAGNNRVQENFYPASFANVISVSATQVDDEFSNWSSYGMLVDVSAPGASVHTTNCYTCTYADHNTWGSHTFISGTSFATPNVAGVVALIRARFPSEAPQQIVDRLFSTVDDLGYPGWDNRYGRGRVNAYRALGAGVSGPGPSSGDTAEPNNTLGAARWLAIDSTIRPSLHPAGDVDVFAVDVPRAGRLEVRVTGVVDTRAYPWNRSGLPIDPIVELYNSAGTLLTRVDAVWESGTELATVEVGGPARVLVRIANWYANGNGTAYSLTTKYVDTGAPYGRIMHPASAATGVSHYVSPTATFSEPVTNVTSSTMRLLDLATGNPVPSTVAFDANRLEARLSPTAPLQAQRSYRVELTGGITDMTGSPLRYNTLDFTTGLSRFGDVDGTPFAVEINWLAGAGITNGCSPEYFCPRQSVTREQMASFLSRALTLPTASTDYFTDDAGSIHEGDINRVAAAGITIGCSDTRYCPDLAVSREQMASFISRALDLPATPRDFFSDDAGSVHEDDINRMAAAGVTNGCGGSSFCPTAPISREHMAAFLYRAFSTR